MNQSDQGEHLAVAAARKGKNSKDHVTIRIEDPNIVQRLDQISQHENSHRKEFIQKLLRLLLLSEEGQRLQEMAENRERSLTSELASWMKQLQGGISWDEICVLAKDSERHPEQMIVFLIRLGLNNYKHKMAAANEDPEGFSLLQ